MGHKTDYHQLIIDISGMDPNLRQLAYAIQQLANACEEMRADIEALKQQIRATAVAD